MISSLSVVIPVYRSETILPHLVERLALVLPTLAKEYEVILVNDDSPDHSWQVILNLCGQYPWIRGINLKRNYGQHNATLCGVRLARYDFILTMDDDLQHPPEEIHKLLEKIVEGYDVVYGIPIELPHTWWRNIMSKLTKKILAYIMNIPHIRDLSAFRVFRAHLRTAFEEFRNPNVILDVLLSWGTTRFATTPVNEMQRKEGKSNYNLWKLINVTMIVLTGFSTKPLRFASMIGFLFTILGILIFLYVIGIYFFVGSIPGFPFLASIISVFSGIQLFSLGIIGEYLGRIFDGSIERPPYVIGEEVSQKYLG